MDLVSGYDSDSEEEAAATTPSSQVAGVSKKLPLPKSSAPQAVGLKLPPPSTSSLLPTAKTTQKRRPEKRQIKINALESIEGEEEQNVAKRTKIEDSGRKGLTGLLGLLPAPKQTGPPPPVDPKEGRDVVVTNMGTPGGSEGKIQLDASAIETKKVKGNNDFRAMLGLKPSNLQQKVALPPKEKAAEVSVPSRESPREELFARELPSIPQKAKEADFFSLQDSSAPASTDNTRSAFAISTAPVVEEEIDEEKLSREAAAAEEKQYEGWQQGPDGNWFPVTPEAHAAYSEYLSTQARQDQFAERPADMQYGDINIMQVVDANAGRQAWQSQPLSQLDTSSSGLDRKYAMAAASIAMPDQGIPLVDQEEEVKKMDKKTNFRARRKGQLSALIAQADEQREKLEERWSKGKEGRNAAKEKYGF